jgi:general secretion pathway protein D
VTKLRLMGAGVVLLLCLACAGGNVFYREGRRAELRKDYDTALVYFEKAVQSEPDNSLFLIHEKTARTLAADFHLRQGRRLQQAKRMDEGAAEFQKAVSIDPSNAAAAQELARIMTEQAAAKRTREKEMQQALKPVEEPAAPPAVKLKPFSSELIAHIHMGPAEPKKIYESLAKLAELNVAFEKTFQNSPNVSLDLTNIKLEDALQVLAYETKTFWKPVTPNTILVIPDNPTNHRDYDEQVLRTIYLTNPFDQASRTQITTAIKTILGPGQQSRIVDNPEANAIIIIDTPAKVAEAEKMIHDLDRGKAEVLVEVAILEADRDRIRDLGLSPVTIGGSTSTQVGIGFNPPGGTTSTSGATTPGTLTLAQLGHISSADFSAVLPGYIANAVLTDARTHILQNPTLRTTDGQKATLNIGQKVPFAQGSFLPSFGGTTTSPSGGLGLLAQTQFQYQDVGVKIELTTHVLPSLEVNLHAKIEITAVGTPQLIGGISEPTFTQRNIEHDIRLKEGEVSLLGGLIQSQVSNSMSGLPGLGQIPLLKHLFSTEEHQLHDTEILVMLTPRVVRLPEAKEGDEVAVRNPSQTGTPVYPGIPGVELPPTLPQEP